jgi:hypothetical protein
MGARDTSFLMDIKVSPPCISGAIVVFKYILMVFRIKRLDCPVATITGTFAAVTQVRCKVKNK